MSSSTNPLPSPGDPSSGEKRPLSGSAFQLVLTAQVGGSGKTQKSLATAIARMEKAKARLQYFEALAAYTDRVDQEKLQLAAREYRACVEHEVRVWDGWYDHCPHKLTKSLSKLLREILVWKLQQAVFEGGITELEPLLDRHCPPPNIEEQTEMLGVAREFMESMTGVKFDGEDFHPNMGPADFARLDEKYGERLRNAADYGPLPPRKKTKKQLAAEIQRKQAEELLDRDLNRLFKDLVLKLHPDREQDPEARLQKEELMKGLIRARDEGDYTELLRMHVEVCGNIAAPDRQLLSEGTVKTLIRLLNEKTGAIQVQTASLRADNLLWAPILRFTEILMTDQQLILEAVQSRAAMFREDTRQVKETLERYQSDSQAFFRYLKSRPHKAGLEDDWGFLGNPGGLGSMRRRG